MFQDLQSLFSDALMQRATLLINHVLAAEPVATDRLRAHSGSSLLIEFNGWPAAFPAPPVVAFAITPAGLLEWMDGDSPAQPDLRVSVDASNPLLWLTHLLRGSRPEVSVAGNAALAADVNWLIDNLRWDLQDDLAALVGAGPAHEIARLARGIAEGVRRAVRTVEGLVVRDGPGFAGDPKPR
jgi:ubiquinone biosynthesis protein UbiJ